MFQKFRHLSLIDLQRIDSFQGLMNDLKSNLESGLTSGNSSDLSTHQFSELLRNLVSDFGSDLDSEGGSGLADDGLGGLRSSFLGGLDDLLGRNLLSGFFSRFLLTKKKFILKDSRKRSIKFSFKYRFLQLNHLSDYETSYKILKECYNKNNKC